MMRPPPSCPNVYATPSAHKRSIPFYVHCCSHCNCYQQFPVLCCSADAIEIHVTPFLYTSSGYFLGVPVAEQTIARTGLMIFVVTHPRLVRPSTHKRTVHVICMRIAWLDGRVVVVIRRTDGRISRSRQVVVNCRGRNRLLYCRRQRQRAIKSKRHSRPEDNFPARRPFFRFIFFTRLVFPIHGTTAAPIFAELAFGVYGGI